jgi:hypothetical protein
MLTFIGTHFPSLIICGFCVLMMLFGDLRCTFAFSISNAGGFRGIHIHGISRMK